MIDIHTIGDKKASHSNKLVRKYMPHIIEVEDHKGTSIAKKWTKDNLTNALLKSINNPKVTNASYLSELFKKLKFSPVTIYSPLMTKRILEHLNCRDVFDPCIGWGGRMLGTTVLGGSYTGCEPFTKTFQGLSSMIQDLDLSSKVNIYPEPVEDVLDKLNDKTYEICLTSPPYYDLEIYSHEDTQSTQRYSSYEEWVSEFLKPIIDYVCSHVTKYSCWSVKNFKTTDQYNLLDDVTKLHEDNDWVRHSLELSIHKNTKANKNSIGDITYIFKPKECQMNISEEAGVLQQPLILANPANVHTISDAKQIVTKILDYNILDLDNPQQQLEELVPQYKHIFQTYLSAINSHQCNEPYEENLSEIFGLTNLTDKHGFDGKDEYGVYYEYKPTKPKSTSNPLTSNVSINDDSEKKIKKCEEKPDTQFIIAVIDRETHTYKMIYQFPMKILTNDRKQHLIKQVAKGSRRIIYGTHIKKCIQLCIDQRIQFHRWVTP